MIKHVSALIILMALFKISFGQSLLPLEDQNWKINHYQGSCYHDTIIHAVWLYIDPKQTLKKYEQDTSFVVIEVTAVNKSPIDLYLLGKNNKLKVPVIEESYVIDSVRLKEENNLLSAMPLKLDKRLAFEREDYSKNPHKDLWNQENRKSLILIPRGARKKLIITIPKRQGDYRIEAIVEFNKERHAYDCEGQKVSWPEYRTISSNKIELKERKR